MSTSCGYPSIPPTGTGLDLQVSSLQIHVVEARDLDQTDFFSAIDPYVVVTVDDGTVYKGAVHEKAGNAPVLNDVFEVTVTSSSMVVHLHVYDKDMCSHDDFLGRLEIPLQWCLEQGSWESWLNLMNQVNEKCGEVYLKVVPKGTFVGRPLPTMA